MDLNTLMNSGMQFSNYNGQQVRTDDRYMQDLSHGAKNMGMSAQEYDKFLNPDTYGARWGSPSSGGTTTTPTSTQASVMSVVNNVPDSVSTTNTSTGTSGFDLNGLYKELFNRDGDAGGMDFWGKAMAGGMTADAVRNEFMKSQEYQALHPTTTPAPSTPFGGMTWDQLLTQAQTDHQNQWSSSDNFDFYSGGTTKVGDNNAQIYLPDFYSLDPDVRAKYGSVRAGETPDGYDPWDHATFKFKDPTFSSPVDQSTDWMTSLSKGDDGNIKVGHYKEYDRFARDMVYFVLTSAAMYAGISAAAGGMGGGAGGGGLGETGGWVSAEGGSGYGLDSLGNMIPVDGAPGTLNGAPWNTVPSTPPVTDNGWTSAEGGSGYDPSTGLPTDGAPGTMNGTPWNSTPSVPSTPSGSTPPSTIPPGGTPPGSGTTIPKVPVLPGTGGGTSGGGTATGGGSGLNIGSLLSLLYGAHSKNQMSKQLEDILGEMRGMYKPGSPEAEQMRKQIEAKDAAAGRRSQYGPREVELAGKLANARMQMLSSPGFMNMQAAYMNNAPGSGGLSEIIAALGGGGNILNGGGNNIISQLFNKIASGVSGDELTNWINSNQSVLEDTGLSVDELLSAF